MLQRQSIGKIASMLVILIFLYAGCGRDQKKQAGKKESEKQAVQAQEKATADHTEEIAGKDGAPMALIPAGEFEMGTDSDEIPQLVEWARKWSANPVTSWHDREKPRHTVHLDAFHMDKYEVTNTLYKKFMDATGHKAPGYWDDDKYNAPNQPVVGITWDDAKAYAEWAGKRLPTEAEWEKAARGGLVGKKFPWGDSDPDGIQCNFADRNTNESWSDKNVDDGYQYAAPVGSFTPNGYGLYDMAGNVWEWCADWYGESYYKISPERNPKGPGSGTDRVLRGGSWLHSPSTIRAALRYSSYSPTRTYYDQGFRCVSQD